jgi:hypothetical protein
MSSRRREEREQRIADDYNMREHPRQWNELTPIQKIGISTLYRRTVAERIADRYEEHPILYPALALGLANLLGGLPGWVLFALEPFHSHSAHLWIILGLGYQMVWTLAAMIAGVLMAVWMGHALLNTELDDSDEPMDSHLLVVPLAMRAMAASVLCAIIVDLIGSFSAIYLQTAHDSARCFSKPMGHADAVYFTITTLTTMGSGLRRTESGLRWVPLARRESGTHQPHRDCGRYCLSGGFPHPRTPAPTLRAALLPIHEPAVTLAPGKSNLHVDPSVLAAWFGAPPLDDEQQPEPTPTLR